MEYSLNKRKIDISKNKLNEHGNKVSMVARVVEQSFEIGWSSSWQYHLNVTEEKKTMCLNWLKWEGKW